MVILRGEDRADLLRRISALRQRLSNTPLLELALALQTELAPGGSRLAIVTASREELAQRLTRAEARLMEASCKQINDRQGVYFTETPLHYEGKLAVLFSGEGAQYLGMLGDLPSHFPEVAKHLAACDCASLQAGGRATPITDAFLIHESANPAERRAAERRLWQLDNAVCGVLTADWGLYLILRRLGLEPDAVAGHSAGEISALAAAGCYDADQFLFQELFALARALQQREDDGRLTETILLAVGAGRSSLAEVISASGQAVDVAMDNCPHQTVLAGSAEAMHSVEAQLQERGIVCERLPFRRPYHTSRFQPFLAPIAQTFERLPIRAPRRAIYSCATAERFPNDPAEIRRLAVANWAARVEFVRLIEAMYADGVRIFIESGPRGNLTAFVEDILRGRPALAIAADLPRRTGRTQLNHLIGQLAAHHVPLDLARFQEVRLPQVCATNSTPRACGEVMEQYWGVMEQFLELQREVVEQFLRRGEGGCDPRPTTAPASARKPPLLGEILCHEPGRLLKTRRSVDLSEDVYALDHTLGGRNASALDPSHHGLPVMPMAFSLEMMAEIAATLAPGLRVIGMRRVRLHRWIPLDVDDPITLEITARVLPMSEGTSAVQVEIHDRGNGSTWKRDADETLAVDGTVLLDHKFPDPPALTEFRLSHEAPCRYTPAQLYAEEQRLFHGPLFQALCSTDRQGQEGIVGHLRTLPHSGLFRSTTSPNLLTDPLLIDASTHLLGCWHLGLPDQTGRVVFPYELGTVELYGPRPAEGERIECRVAIEKSSARQVSHRIELIRPDGQLWCRLHPAEYWRFYWPEEYTAYFRRKDVYLLGQRWPQVEALAKARAVCCMRIAPPADLTQPVMRGMLAHVSLSRAEWQQFRTLPGPGARKTEWLFGRIAAKDAARALWHEHRGERWLPADMEMAPDASGRPQVMHPACPEAARRLDVSISHADGLVVALAAFDCRAGIDLERIQPRGDGFEAIAFDEGERRLLDQCGGAREEWTARFWCAREAAAKALGQGQVEGARSLAVRAMQRESGVAQVALGQRLAELCPDRRDTTLTVATVREGEWIAAVCFLERTDA